MNTTKITLSRNPFKQVNPSYKAINKKILISFINFVVIPSNRSILLMEDTMDIYKDYIGRNPFKQVNPSYIINFDDNLISEDDVVIPSNRSILLIVPFSIY